MATLETQLIKAVQEENLDEVRSLIERGAKINISTSGRTPLSIAAYLGSIPMLELLLHSGQFSPQNETPEAENNTIRKTRNKNDAEKNKPSQNNRRAKRKRPTPDDGTKDDATTPEGMDNLEWDMEVHDDEQLGSNSSEEEDRWSNQYRWYAKILANTYCTMQESPHNVCDVNLQDSIGRCAIHYASEYGHPNAVKLLINAGARVDIGDVDNLTALHLAANRGHLDVVEVLLTSGAAVNCKTTDKLSALHYAASRGYADIASVLLVHGTNVDSLDATDRTPLKLAVSRNLYDVAKVLVDRGARVNLEDIKGYTPLCEAVWQKSVKLAHLLLEAGAKVTPTPYLLHYSVLHQHYDMAELLLKYGSLVNIRDNHGDTPLMTAAISGQTSIVRLLLNYGAHVDCFAAIGERTPLYSAVTAKGRTNPDVVRALIEGGADMDRACWNETPLTSAIVYKKYNIANILIGLGADVHRQAPTVSGPRDPMTIARLCGAIPVIKMLVLAGYDLNKITRDVSSRSDADLDTVDGVLTYHKKNPLSLCNLTRVRIRSLCRNSSLINFANSLGLPPFLVKFLLMEDSLERESPQQSEPPKINLLLPDVEF